MSSSVVPCLSVLDVFLIDAYELSLNLPYSRCLIIFLFISLCLMLSMIIHIRRVYVTLRFSSF